MPLSQQVLAWALTSVQAALSLLLESGLKKSLPLSSTAYSSPCKCALTALILNLHIGGKSGDKSEETNSAPTIFSYIRFWPNKTSTVPLPKGWSAKPILDRALPHEWSLCPRSGLQGYSWLWGRRIDPGRGKEIYWNCDFIGLQSFSPGGQHIDCEQ